MRSESEKETGTATLIKTPKFKIPPQKFLTS